MADDLDRLFAGLASEAAPPPGAAHEAHERMVRRMTRDARLAGGFALVLLLWTLWWLGVNLVVLSRSVPEDLTFSVESVSRHQAAYAASVEWSPEVSKGPLPRVVLRGDTLAPDDSGVRLRTGQPYRLNLIIPTGVPAGDYRGHVVLTLAEGPTELPDTIRVPLEVEVVRGFLSDSWSIVRRAIVLAVLIAVAFYGLMVLMFPGPTGRLLIEGPSVRQGLTPVTVRLRVSGHGWLMPWSRSRLALRRVMHWADQRAASSPDGELTFWLHGLPPRLVLRAPAFLRRATARHGTLEARRGAKFTDAGSAEFMDPAAVYQLCSPGRDPITIRFEP